MSKKLILAGGTGNIGRLIIDRYRELNWHIVVLTRQQKQSDDRLVTYVCWDGESLAEWAAELEGADTLINLSGKSIQCRFTAKNKELLLASRLMPTRILGQAIASLQAPPRLWINFSGISLFEGLDGHHDEDSNQVGTTFLSELTGKWEKTFFNADTPGTHKVCLRLSPVLSKDFGMFKELYPLSKFGLAGKVGNGQQLVSWIHQDDLINMIHWIIGLPEPSLIYHACTKEPVANKIFMQKLQEVTGFPYEIPLPSPLAKIGAYFKGVESDMLLLSNPVYAKNASREGFIYRYADLRMALENLVNK